MKTQSVIERRELALLAGALVLFLGIALWLWCSGEEGLELAATTTPAAIDSGEFRRVHQPALKAHSELEPGSVVSTSPDDAMEARAHSLADEHFLVRVVCSKTERPVVGAHVHWRHELIHRTLDGGGDRRLRWPIGTPDTGIVRTDSRGSAKIPATEYAANLYVDGEDWAGYAHHDHRFLRPGQDLLTLSITITPTQTVRVLDHEGMPAVGVPIGVGTPWEDGGLSDEWTEVNFTDSQGMVRFEAEDDDEDEVESELVFGPAFPCKEPHLLRIQGRRERHEIPTLRLPPYGMLRVGLPPEERECTTAARGEVEIAAIIHPKSEAPDDEENLPWKNFYHLRTSLDGHWLECGPVGLGLRFSAARPPPRTSENDYSVVEATFSGPTQSHEAMEFILPPGPERPRLRGRVVTENGEASAGVEVGIILDESKDADGYGDSDASFTTLDADGTFDIPLSEYMVDVLRKRRSRQRPVFWHVLRSHRKLNAGGTSFARATVPWIPSSSDERALDLGVVNLAPLPLIARGRVVDPQGQPLAGVKIWALDEDGRPLGSDAHLWSLRTDSRGQFEMRRDLDPAPDSFPLHLVAHREGLDFWVSPTPVPIESELTIVLAPSLPLQIRVVTDPTLDEYPLRIRAREPRDSENIGTRPPHGVEELESPSTPEVLSWMSGRKDSPRTFSFECLPAGSIEVELSFDVDWAYAPRAVALRRVLTRGTARNLELDLRGLIPTRGLSVFDSQGQQVSARLCARTDLEGKYYLETSAHGPVFIPDSLMSLYGVVSLPGHRAHIFGGRTPTGNLHLQAAPRRKLTVTSADGGDRIRPGLKLHIFPPDSKNWDGQQSVEVGAAGDATFRPNQLGTWFARVIHEDFPLRQPSLRFTVNSFSDRGPIRLHIPAPASTR